MLQNITAVATTHVQTTLAVFVQTREALPSLVDLIPIHKLYQLLLT